LDLLNKQSYYAKTSVSVRVQKEEDLYLQHDLLKNVDVF